VPDQALAMYDEAARRPHDFGAKRQALLGERGRGRVDPGRAPTAGSKSRVEFDVRQSLANRASVDLTRVNSLGVTVVMKLLTEIGPDVSRCVREYLDGDKGKVEVARLAASSLDRNLVEHLRGWLKRHTLANFCPKSLPDFTTTARNKLRCG
jgi:hypothetical protein